MPEKTTRPPLTTIDWRSLPPGRDLDAVVAEYARGYERRPVGPDAHGEHAGEVLVAPEELFEDRYASHLPNVGRVPLAYFAPPWSTTDAAALLLVDQRRRLHWTRIIIGHAGMSNPNAYDVQMGVYPTGDDPSREVSFARCDTLSHAICVALLTFIELTECA